MYSWEITKTMQHYDYCLPSYVYLDMTENSPQLNRISFINTSNPRFEMWDEEGEYWNFSVYHDEAA